MFVLVLKSKFFSDIYTEQISAFVALEVASIIYSTVTVLIILYYFL